MPKLPDQLKSWLDAYLEVSSEYRDKLASILATELHATSTKALIDSVVSRSGLSAEIVRRGVNIAVELHRGMTVYDSNPNEFSQDIASGKEETAKEISRLVSLRIVKVLAKARDASSDSERNFLDCTIYSDIRPLFVDAPTEKPAAFLIKHTMHVSYRHGGLPETIQIDVDSDDLVTIKQAVERALDKAGSMKKHISAPECGWLECNA